MPAIVISSACFGYRRKQVLHSINLETADGEFLGVIGPNGSGKTTLLKAMSGLLKTWSGHITLNGENIRSYRREDLARHVALLPQNAVLPELFTALDIVLMGRMPHLGLIRYESSRDVRIALDAMEATQTTQLARRRMNEVSGGEKQRVVIARALTQEARILMLDEQTANLDINYQSEILSFLRKLCRERQMTVIAALHDLNLASQYCDRLVMLNNGTIYRQGTPVEVIEVDAIREVFGAEVMVHPHPINGLPTTLIAPQNHRTGS